MKKQSEIWNEIQKTLPETDPEELRRRVDFSLAFYDGRRLLSRDTAPTLPQLLEWLKDIHNSLEEVSKLLNKDESAFLVLGLSHELDRASRSPVKFAEQIIDLIEATRRAIDKAEAGSLLAINGKRHTRKTRTETRDEVLIPMLTGHFIQLAVDPLEFYDELDPMDPCKDDEFIDQACRFVSLVLQYAEIPAPDIGPDVGRVGAPAQGRLRRAVKEAARGLTNSGLKPSR